MKNSLRVAVAQISSTAQWEENLQTAVDLIQQAADGGAGLVVFPEATIANFTVPTAQSAQPLDGPFASGIRDAAAKAGIVAVVGMFEPAEDGRAYNTLLITGRAGEQEVEASYRKIHLFDAFGHKESDTVKPGTEHVVIDIAGVKVGFAICYDVRFADQFNKLGLLGAQIVCLPTSWGDGPGKAEQWDVLTRARAMDSQAWLVACDQAWQPPQGAAPLGVGRSVVVDPLGGVRGRLASGPDMLFADLDLDIVDQVRGRVPVLEGLRALADNA